MWIGPIQFSDLMIRALLDDRKHATRRQLWNQWQKTGRPPSAQKIEFLERYPVTEDVLPVGKQWMLGTWHNRQPGDLLYVREGLRMTDRGVVYSATGDLLDNSQVPDDFAPRNDWCAPMHMPRWASRIWLTLTDVKIERVQEISEVDARAEGVTPTGWEGSDVPDHCRIAFRDLWNSLHTRPGYRWDDNPWVVALSFTVHRGNIDRRE